MGLGDVEITIQDGGANTTIQVPSQAVQVVIGCLLSVATVQANQIVSTRSPTTLQQVFKGGSLCEAAALTCQAGGTVLAIGVPIATAGTATTPVTSGTGTALAVFTVTLDGTNGAWDDYYVVYKVVTGGTIGTAGITFKVSLDAGRNFGPTIALGTATSYAIPNTGVTLSVGSATHTYVAGDTVQFATIAPLWNDAGLSAAITALQASPYALAGWGSSHVVGVSAASDATALGNSSNGYLEVLASGYIYTRVLISARDAIVPVAWGGAGESEQTWISSLETAWSAVSAKRVVASAGYYNMPSAYPNTAAGTPAYRRSLVWADAARRVQVPPQRHGGRVRDGSLGNIVVNPSSDPTDGFVYHDERLNPSLDAARFLTARTRVKLQGFFVTNENLMSPVGSQFTILPLGNAMDLVCTVAYAQGSQVINDDLRLNANGTLYVADALALQNDINGAIQSNVTNQSVISGQSVVVDQTANVEETSTIPVTISVTPRGYASTLQETIGFSIAAAA
jgi:Protein of unknown function (DUF2586)